MDAVIQRYWKHVPKRRLYETVLTSLVLVYQWLLDLTTQARLFNEEPERALNQAGFTKAIAGATILAGEET